MQVQKISSPAFEGRIRIIKDPEKFAKQFNEAYQNLPPEAKVVSGSTNLTLSMSTGTAVPLANTAALGSSVAGAGLSAHAIGADSFGIAPFAAEKVLATTSPSAARSAEEYPILSGGIFSAAGGWLAKHFRFGNPHHTKKIPS